MRRASPYPFPVLECLLREHFPFPRRLLQLHELLLTSGALLSDSPCAAFPYNCLAHAHLRVSTALHLLSPTPPLLRHAQPRRAPPTATRFLPCPNRPAPLPPSPRRSTRSVSAAADRFVACSLISAYARSGHPARDARKVFDESGGSPDLASRNALLEALCLAGDLAAAESFFEQMAVRDAVSWTTLVFGLSWAGRHRCALPAFREFFLEHKGRLAEANTGQCALGLWAFFWEGYPPVHRPS
jgi:pentatricopeptide repeat protein